jgi:AAA+ ATPase superfamily predicted ATPase
MKFYDREKDVEYFKKYFLLEPNSILFVYGPKSSGKSTVIRRVIKEMENSDVVFFYYNLREYATPTKEEFLEIFFEKSKSSVVKNKYILDLKVFKFGMEKTKDLTNIRLNDVFKEIKESINYVVKEGKRPVLIIDELQKLRNIYFNGGKNLLNELLNFFVSLTKMEHLCHVVCLTSDTLFIEEIYRNSSLENTSEYYLIDWLDNKTVKNILKEEGFDSKEIEFASKYVSLPYEIVQLKNNKNLGIPVKETIVRWIKMEKTRLLQIIAKSEFDEEKLYEILNKLRHSLRQLPLAVPRQQY